MNWEQQVFDRAEQFLKSNRLLQFTGPLWMNQAEHQGMIREIIEFRSKQNQVRADYLESDSQQKIEHILALDARSIHFSLSLRGQIAASVRITPPTFELGLLLPSLDLSAYQGFYEISRLCTNVMAGKKALLAQALVIRAGHWLFSATNARGIVAICKDENLDYLNRFGMIALKSGLRIPGREGTYHLIGNTRAEIMAQIDRQLDHTKTKGVNYEPQHA